MTCHWVMLKIGVVLLACKSLAAVEGQQSIIYFCSKFLKNVTFWSQMYWACKYDSYNFHQLTKLTFSFLELLRTLKVLLVWNVLIMEDVLKLYMYIIKAAKINLGGHKGCSVSASLQTQVCRNFTVGLNCFYEVKIAVWSWVQISRINIRELLHSPCFVQSETWLFYGP